MSASRCITILIIVIELVTFPGTPPRGGGGGARAPRECIIRIVTTPITIGAPPRDALSPHHRYETRNNGAVSGRIVTTLITVCASPRDALHPRIVTTLITMRGDPRECINPTNTPSPTSTTPIKPLHATPTTPVTPITTQGAEQMVVIETSFGDKVEIDDDTARERGWERIKAAGAEERVKHLLTQAERMGVSTNRVKKAILHLGAALTALESDNLPTPTKWELEGLIGHYEEHLIREIERLERKVSAKKNADKLAERLLEEEKPVIGFNVSDSEEAADELYRALREHGVRAILANLAFGTPGESARVVVVTDKESIERIVGEGKNEEVRERVKDRYSRLFSRLNAKVIAVLFVEEAREVARVLMERAED